jgi:hypothetical protein
VVWQSRLNGVADTSSTYVDCIIFAKACHRFGCDVFTAQLFLRQEKDIKHF